jgi:alpha-galactosidase
MPDEVISQFQVGDLTFIFVRDAASESIGLQLIPAGLLDRMVSHRTGLGGLPYIDAIPGAGNPAARVIDPLVHVKLRGDPYTGGFAQGHTMRGSPSNSAFKYGGQRTEQFSGGQVVITRLTNPAGYEMEHRLRWFEGAASAEIESVFHNFSSAPVTLEMMTSFSLGGISPFHAADAPNRLRVHRFRSVWSAEGRHLSESMEELHLERSWSGAGVFSERFGQIGSMPVRKWFPFVAIEDTEAGVVWGAQLAWAGSWQMEIFRQHDDVCISGGLADREFGHWMKTLLPGEALTTPTATLSCVQGNLDDLCDRLTAAQERALTKHPAIEEQLPIVFNEWCTSWGDPRHERLVAIAERLKETEVKYLVIDAGWYKSGSANWDNGHGDWMASTDLFPRGLEAAAAAIRERGLVPGLWFEMETCGESSAAFSMIDLLLKRDGIPVTVRGRRFWNLNNPGAIEYLTTRVIDLLERCGFGYLKVDYNETIGLGSDHSDSLGEGLRQQVEGIYRFFDLIRQRLPNLVIENCSSGGHRLEPSMLACTAMSSFSDAHELPEIPMIAANLHQLILPRQSQIWAVLHPSDSDERLIYSLAATFLGRMCLSGDIEGLNSRQWSLVQRAMQLYRSVTPVIRNGVSRRFGDMGKSWRHPTGWQAVRRVSADGRTAVIVAHAFAECSREAVVPLTNSAEWRIRDTFGTHASELRAEGLLCRWPSDFSASVTVLSRF